MTRARDVANLIGSGNYSSTTFTATAGQTAFTISHTQGFIQVFMNGLLLDETVDYTSNGSAVTLTSGAAAGDEIEVVAYNTFSVGDAITQSGADARYYTQSAADARYQNISTNVVASAGFGYTNHNSNGTYVNLGGLTLPSSGIWVVSYQSRFGYKAHSAYHKVALSTSTSSGGVFSTYRMVAERIGNHDANNANIAGNHMWYIDVANGNSSKSIYVISYQSGTSTAAFYQDDGNGETGLIAWKLRESTTSGTGVSNVGL